MAVKAPTSVVANGGTSTIIVNWTPGENATGHLIVVAQGTTLVGFQVATGTGTTATFSDLDAGEYRVVVIAFRGTGSTLDYKFASDNATVN